MVTMLPYLERKERRTGSRSAKFLEDLRSQNMLPKTGMVGGLGGSLLLLMILRKT